MSTVVRLGAASLLLVHLAGCHNAGPTSPTGTNAPPILPAPVPSPPPPAQVSFPPLSGPSRTFMFNREVSYRVSDFTAGSRFVLYDNGAFGLQYPTFTFRGAYRESDGVIMFLFDSPTGRTEGEPWDDAIGTLRGDSLTVVYDELLQHSDFENAVYVLVP